MGPFELIVVLPEKTTNESSCVAGPPTGPPMRPHLEDERKKLATLLTDVEKWKAAAELELLKDFRETLEKASRDSIEKLRAEIENPPCCKEELENGTSRADLKDIK